MRTVGMMLPLGIAITEPVPPLVVEPELSDLELEDVVGGLARPWLEAVHLPTVKVEEGEVGYR